MAFGAVGFLILAESLRAVMANAAMLVLSVGFLCHLQIFFLHLEDFGVTVRAFQLLLSYMGFMTEGDGTGAALGFKFDVPAAHFFLLGIGHLKSCKTQNTNTDEQNLPNPFPQDFTSLHRKTTRSFKAYLHNSTLHSVYRFGKRFVKEKIF